MFFFNDSDPDEVNAEFCQAAKDGNVKTVRLLLEEGVADAECRSFFRGTPLNVAPLTRVTLAWSGSSPRRPAQPSTARTIMDGTPTRSAAINGPPGSRPAFSRRRGAADVNKADSSGTTPLHATAVFNRLEVVKWLVAKGGAGVYKANNHGSAPLPAAIATEIIGDLLNDRPPHDQPRPHCRRVLPPALVPQRPPPPLPSSPPSTSLAPPGAFSSFGVRAAPVPRCPLMMASCGVIIEFV